MRNKPDAAEPYFERLRKYEPAHPGMLGFFREWCVQKGEQTRLVQILTDAQRAMPDGPERAKLAARDRSSSRRKVRTRRRRSSSGVRSCARSRPTSRRPAMALKRLYRSSGSYNHLADLLRSRLERVAPDDGAARLPVLREIAQIYRENIKSDSALVTVLSQIIALDGKDAERGPRARGCLEALGRWRDLLDDTDAPRRASSPMLA